MISVIIPTYNSERYISECLNSVINQTYSNLEIIVVDDGSTDNTNVIVNSVMDYRIKYFYKENGGVASARNLGITKSTGLFIAFLDSDDFWHKEKLERQIKLMADYDFVYCNHNTIDKNGIEMEYKLPCPISGRDDIKKAILSSNTITGSCSTVFMKKVVLDKVGLFNSNLRIGEDWEYWAKVVWNEFKIGFIEENLAVLRSQNNSIQYTTLKHDWCFDIEVLLLSFLNFSNLESFHKGIIYKRLGVNSYNWGTSFLKLVKYYFKAIQQDFRFVFDIDLLLLMAKYYPRSIKIKIDLMKSYKINTMP
jgi:glycosyltransferase involved in cell wall biosynthesis